MHARINHVTFDCREPLALARFWGAVLGFIVDVGDDPQPADDEVGIVDPTGRHPMLLFIRVPDAKQLKNRLHLDVGAVTTRDVAVEEILRLGATHVDDQRRPDGTGWVVLADPEGNEFCVERSPAERGIVAVTVDVEEQAFAPLTYTGGEREMLTLMLDWYRAAVLRKVEAISVTALRRSPVRSGTTVAGLLKHLAGVEDAWFHERFAGLPEVEPWASMPHDDPEWDFTSALDDPLDELVALYRSACDRSRRAADGRSLDDHAVSGRRDFVLRFAFLHLIEETARHLGHMDIVREFHDGTTGE